VLLQRALRLRSAARIQKKQPIAVRTHIAAVAAISLIVCIVPSGIIPTPGKFGDNSYQSNLSVA
jgi:hypothetical protein